MRKVSRVLVLSTLVLVGACQGPQGGSADQTNTQTPPDYIQAADGSFFSISCLRQNAQAIQQSGSSAAAQCQTDGSSLRAEASSRGNSRASYLFYYYYPPSYWTTYYSGAYNYNNPYNSYFCSYIFGITWNSSCYSNIFGYNNSYSTGLGSCYQCYGYSSYCYNTCWYGYY